MFDGNFAEDIETVDPKKIPDFDILCAGFPCQPFSIAGKLKGFADPRGNIFFEIIRILKVKKPKAFFLENVRNLISHDKGRTFKIIRDSLESLGYSFHFKVIKACDFGLPQYRPRVFMIGFRRKVTAFMFPEPIPLKMSMSDIFGALCNRKIGFTLLTGGRGGKIGSRYNWDAYLVNGKIRHLSIKEGKKMMGFPDAFVMPVSETQAMKQLGNSVAVPAIGKVAEKLLVALDGQNDYI